MSESLWMALVLLGLPALIGFGFLVYGLVLAAVGVERCINPYWSVRR